MAEHIRTTDEIRAWLIAHLASLLRVEPDSIDPHTAFASLGLASRDAVALSGDLEEWLGVRISPTIAYQFPTIERLAQHLGQDQAPRSLAQPAPPIAERDKADRKNARQAEQTRAAELAAISDEEAEALLLETLAMLEV